MNLSKSRYCSAVQCPKILWMQAHKPEEYDDSVMNESILATGNAVGDLAMGYYGDFTEIAYSADKSAMLAATRDALNSGVAVIAEASFAFDGNFCSVDILRNFGDYVEIVEVKSSTELKPIYLHDMAYQSYVLQQCGLNVRRVSLMHINNQYVRQGELDLQQLFAVEDHTEEINALIADIPANVARFKAIAEQNGEPEIGISESCDAPYECGYKGYCWRDIPENSVFDVAGHMRSARKWDLYRRGITTFAELLESGEKLSDKQRRQVTLELSRGEPAINRGEIRLFLKSLRYPLYHLDFETYQSAVPEYDGLRPYVQVPFQYSLHIEHTEGAESEHREFLAEAGTDPRRAFAERLCADIPADACVLVYNKAFEQTRLRELAGYFPDLSRHLTAIRENIEDLMLPFANQDYYHWRFGGSYSIKYVLPAMCPDDSELDYHALDLIQNGGDAMSAFPTLAAMPPDEAARYRRALLAYCRLDTLAMVKILERLRECVG
ncbi:MAG: DUF2779 domain-containing protein [Oscillospiraceae bacterium]|jgi:CRISPR/Cas system-associated exonuclease Cas4 (RecB family)|nr:DUF2779 domain-containing protein [Oscillospiraceae bacterium]